VAKFEFQIENQAFDEVVVGDKTYKLYFDDASLERYQKQAKTYANESMKFAEMDVTNLSDEEQERLKEKSNEIARNFIETFFGNGSYEEIFNACGKSSFNLIHVVDQVMDWLSKKYVKIDELKKAKYKPKRMK
jgi:hypothetical protein